MPCELTITVKSEDKVFKKKIIIQGSLILDRNDSKLRELVRDVLNEFNDEAEAIIVTAKLNLTDYA